MRKIVLVIEKKKLKFETEGQEFAKVLRSLEQFIQTVKGQDNFWKQNLFYLVPVKRKIRKDYLYRMIGKFLIVYLCKHVY